MRPGDLAREYHRLTGYALGDDFPSVPADHPLVVQDFVPNDLERLPAPCKVYPRGLPRVELPDAWPVPQSPATAVLAGAPAAPQPVTVPALARVLYLSSGVVRTTRRKGRTFLFRAAGSAGGRFPLELYVAARGVPLLDDGVYWYDPVAHALVRIGPSADGQATTLIVTGVPWRTAWRYSERGLRHIYWDAGTMLSQALALADSAGFAPRLYTRFPDARLTRLTGADGTHEFPVALVALGPGAPAVTGESSAGAVDAAPLEFPLITRTQRAGDADALGEPWPAPPGAPIPDPPSPEKPLDDVILARGSTRRMDAQATVPQQTFEFMLTAALRGARFPHFVAVHAVNDVEPGLYRWPRPLRLEPLRETLLRVCWDQNLGRDAAFVVIGAADLTQLDDRGYREAQLDAGLVEGRLHLAAYALGFGASGMTFLDSEIAGLLGEPLAGLLFTCVGVPTYRSADGGPPGAPTTVAIPEAGLTLPAN